MAQRVPNDGLYLIVLAEGLLDPISNLGKATKQGLGPIMIYKEPMFMIWHDILSPPRSMQSASASPTFMGIDGGCGLLQDMVG